jgi:hypothetical protein
VSTRDFLKNGGKMVAKWWKMVVKWLQNGGKTDHMDRMVVKWWKWWKMVEMVEKWWKWWKWW